MVGVVGVVGSLMPLLELASLAVESERAGERSRRLKSVLRSSSKDEVCLYSGKACENRVFSTKLTKRLSKHAQDLQEGLLCLCIVAFADNRGRCAHNQ